MIDRNAIATEWGLPDWQDESSYGNTSSWSFMRWRWEFTRRRDDYRNDFDNWKDQTYDFWVNARKLENKLPDTLLTPDVPGFTAMIRDGSFKYGYTALPNPRISEQPDHVIFSSLEYDGNISFINGVGDRHWGDLFNVSAGEGEVLVKFDIDKPLEPQLAAAKDNLLAYQKIKHGKKLQKRRHPQKWLLYLRLLDGREMGASWSQLEAILPSDASTPQSARDAYTQAKALCFNF